MDRIDDLRLCDGLTAADDTAVEAVLRDESLALFVREGMEDMAGRTALLPVGLLLCTRCFNDEACEVFRDGWCRGEAR